MQIISFLFEKHLDKTVLVIAVILSILMLSADDDSQINSARAISTFLFYPVNRVSAYFTDMEQLKDENMRLRELAATLHHERERLTQFREERNRLRQLLGFRKDSFFDFVPCEVTTRSSNRFHHSVTVDRGKGSGIKVGMAVVGYRGLVGRVVQVFGSSSRVILLNNKSISVSCLDKRSRVVGMLNWERGNLFKLDFIGTEEDVLQGDTLITSGFGKILPKGFPVGTVFQVAEEKTELSRRVSVVSMTDLNTLEELFIVVGGRDWDSEDIFKRLDIMKDPAK
jgi:rod shape-determining protein MreC